MNQEEPEEFWQGVEQFNQGQFYACHDTLEALWMEATEPEKTFYQGVLQVAVGLYHLGNKNWHGAVILLGEGIKRLDRYPSAYSGIDVDELIISSADLLKTLQQAGAEKVGTWQLGISPEQVAIAPHCTYQEPERFFSYRRDKQKKVQWSGIISQ